MAGASEEARAQLRWRLADESAALLARAEVPRMDGYVLSVLSFVDACKGRVDDARSFFLRAGDGPKPPAGRG